MSAPCFRLLGSVRVCRRFREGCRGEYWDTKARTPVWCQPSFLGAPMAEPTQGRPLLPKGAVGFPECCGFCFQVGGNPGRGAPRGPWLLAGTLVWIPVCPGTLGNGPHSLSPPDLHTSKSAHLTGLRRPRGVSNTRGVCFLCHSLGAARRKPF